MVNKFDCDTCDTNGTIEEVGFYEMGTGMVCEYCYLEARKMDNDE